jgi:hypothetical protein
MEAGECLGKMDEEWILNRLSRCRRDGADFGDLYTHHASVVAWAFSSKLVASNYGSPMVGFVFSKRQGM